MVASGAMSVTLRLALAVLCVAGSITLAGCGLVSTTPPAPTPADFLGIATELSKRGIGVDGVVSGDAGCTDRQLIPTAIAFTAQGLDQTKPVRVYLYVFRNRDSYDRLRSLVDGCAQSFVTDPATFESVEQSPYVVAGQGPWAPRFKAAMRDAITTAAGTGG